MRLPRLPQAAIVDPKTGLPSLAFTTYWQKLLEAQEAIDAEQSAQLAAILAAQNTATAALKEAARISSYADPTAVLTAADAGTDASITIADHVRVYPAKGDYDVDDLAVTGATLTGRAFSTEYFVYYDDPTLADTTPNYQTTTVFKDAQVGAAPGRHFVGGVTTPADGGGTTTGGGGRPPGGYGDIDP